MGLYNNVSIKKYFLGAEFPGQRLCECVIDIAENGIFVTVRKGGLIVRHKSFEDPEAAARYKSLLREFVKRKLPGSRWVLRASKLKGFAKLYIYYPESDWGAGTRNPRNRAFGNWWN